MVYIVVYTVYIYIYIHVYIYIYIYIYTYVYIYIYTHMYIYIYIWRFPKNGGYPNNGWYIMEDPTKVDDLVGTPILENLHIIIYHLP